MQRQRRQLDAPGLQRRKQRRGEMQSRRRRRHGARPLGKEGLVILAVLGVALGPALDVGGKRHDAQRVQRRQQFGPGEREPDGSGFAYLDSDRIGGVVFELIQRSAA